MSLDSNAERKAYEAAHRAKFRYMKDYYAFDDERGVYFDPVMENYWQVWQLARSQPSEWVATSERMPGSGVRVLFAWRNDLGKPRTSAGIYAAKFSVEAGSDWDDEFADYHEGSDTYYRPEGFWEEGWDTEECALIKDVTHWMPLPKPPALLPPNTEAK